MSKKIKLRCIIEKTNVEDRYRITSSLVDGTSFSMDVFRNYVDFAGQTFDENNTRLEGWLVVEEMGRQKDKVYITLPESSMHYGKNVTVSATNLVTDALSNILKNK